MVGMNLPGSGNPLSHFAVSPTFAREDIHVAVRYELRVVALCPGFVTVDWRTPRWVDRWKNRLSSPGLYPTLRDRRQTNLWTVRAAGTPLNVSRRSTALTAATPTVVAYGGDRPAADSSVHPPLSTFGHCCIIRLFLLSSLHRSRLHQADNRCWSVVYLACPSNSCDRPFVTRRRRPAQLRTAHHSGFGGRRVGRSRPRCSQTWPTSRASADACRRPPGFLNGQADQFPRGSSPHPPGSRPPASSHFLRRERDLPGRRSMTPIRADGLAVAIRVPTAANHLSWPSALSLFSSGGFSRGPVLITCHCRLANPGVGAWPARSLQGSSTCARTLDVGAGGRVVFRNRLRQSAPRGWSPNPQSASCIRRSTVPAATSSVPSVTFAFLPTAGK